MLWILLTAAAAPLQVARNALQRGLVGDAGPWGATLVRFLFGLPFSIVIFAVAAALTPHAHPQASWRFAGAVAAGSVSQIAATAALLVAMRRAGFAVATVMQQSSMPLAAVFGWMLGDQLRPLVWCGIALTSVGVVILSWLKREQWKGLWLGSLLGIGSGVAFAVSLNAYREAGLALEPRHPIYSAAAGVLVAQAVQSAIMVLALGVWRPGVLLAVARSWRVSLGAGFFGATASACWFGALALSPAGPVRALGAIEAPIAAAAGRRLFKEKLTVRQVVGGTLVVAGVILTALG